jgi:hypothetical protein
MSKYGMHAPKGTVGGFLYLYIHLYSMRIGKGPEKIVLISSGVSGPKIMPESKREDDAKMTATPVSAYMCEIEPHNFFFLH